MRIFLLLRTCIFLVTTLNAEGSFPSKIDVENFLKARASDDFLSLLHSELYCKKF